MKNIANLLLASGLIMVFRCNFEKTEINDKKDKENALKLVSEFYTTLESENYDKAYGFFISKNTNLSVSERDTLLKRLFVSQLMKFGKISNVAIKSVTTKVSQEGNSKTGAYLLTYLVTRGDLHQTIEDSFLLIIENSNLRIANYNSRPIVLN